MIIDGEKTVGLRQHWHLIAWWEKRRVLFNLALLAAGIISILVVEFVGSRFAYPGEDVEEPLGLIFGVVLYGIAANICYTLGWATELMGRRRDPKVAEQQRRKAFKLGMIFSVGLTLSPSVLIPIFWFFFGFHH